MSSKKASKKEIGGTQKGAMLGYFAAKPVEPKEKRVYTEEEIAEFQENKRIRKEEEEAERNRNAKRREEAFKMRQQWDIRYAKSSDKHIVKQSCDIVDTVSLLRSY